VGELCSFGSSEIDYPVTLGHVPEESNSQAHYREELKTSKSFDYLTWTA